MTTLFGAVGPLAVVTMLVIMAQLSRRLGEVTSAPPYYIGLLLGAVLVGLGGVMRLIVGFGGERLPAWSGWPLVVHGLHALGLTLGVVAAWRYWSWLLAERD